MGQPPTNSESLSTSPQQTASPSGGHDRLGELASKFVFATCVPGLEPALKREVARTRPELRLAFSRPGLVTFKTPREVLPNDSPGSVFAQVWGLSLGPVRSLAEARSTLADRGTKRVHVFSREPESVVELTPWQELGPGGPANAHELVADVIVADGEPAWLGLHEHRAGQPSLPGGAIPVDIPEDAPARSYAKIEQAIRWASLPVAAGQVALELGAAPGGAALALARRGLLVWAVDPAELAPSVAALPNVQHLKKTLAGLSREALPKKIDWLLVDVNLAPQAMLHELRRLLPRFGGSLRGAVLTLKLNDWRFVDELPLLQDKIKALGFAQVQLRHLPSNRREVCAVGLTAHPG